jgi:hypothetical protein
LLDINTISETRKRFDVSTEAVLIRLAHLSDEPCAVFMASGREAVKCLGVVADWYAPYRQVRPCCDDPAPPAVDPKGPAAGPYHVLRGGSWNDFSADVKMSLRDHLKSPDEESALDYDSYSTGFRCAGD